MRQPKIHSQFHTAPNDLRLRPIDERRVNAKGHRMFYAGLRREVGQALKYRDEVARSMTPAEIAQARRLASEWKPKGRTTSDGRRSPN